ncbi:MAG TPA: HAD family hydrolase [Planctomycetota bacterium]|jgi:histidinol-phosphate phosphatase family protein
MLRRAVFLDRDGVVNVWPGPESFVLKWELFSFMPDVSAQLLRLRKAGLFLALITNQSCVGRGLMSLEELQKIHARMQAELGAAALDGIYYCPHAPDAGCSCRKPSPEMILRACEEHGLSAQESFMVGDSGRDIEMGRAAGCHTILCRENLPVLEKMKPPHRPEYMARTLADAVDWIVKRL